MTGYYTGDLSLPLLKYFWIEIRTRFKIQGEHRFLAALILFVPDCLGLEI